MLLTSERVSPCRARCSRSSSGRRTWRTPSSSDTVMSGGSVRDSSPRGPFTDTRRSSRVTVTPAGTGMGDRPIRDMSTYLPSPHVAEDFPADPALARLLVGEEPLARGQDRDAEPSEDPGQPVGFGVHPQAGL